MIWTGRKCQSRPPDYERERGERERERERDREKRERESYITEPFKDK